MGLTIEEKQLVLLWVRQGITIRDPKFLHNCIDAEISVKAALEFLRSEDLDVAFESEFLAAVPEILRKTRIWKKAQDHEASMYGNLKINFREKGREGLRERLQWYTEVLSFLSEEELKSEDRELLKVLNSLGYKGEKK